MQLITPLNAQELDDLDQALRDLQAMDLSTFDGFCTALVSSPNLLGSEQWLPQVFKEHSLDDAKIEAIVPLLIRHLNGIESILSRAPEKFDPLFLERDLHDSVDVIVENWCRGYTKGIALNAEDWNKEPESLQAYLYPILIFSGKAGEKVRQQSDRTQILQWKSEIAPAARNLYSHWYQQRNSSERSRQLPFTRSEPKTGRNELCPCGSGRKYKLCCGAH
ncbi:UPF0149 family protein [Pleionea litopenaei]|uniref:UPF0149 family protein n=1 Tax=Pleionea litopenaei TaxID=3070815 RepID=A0AA51RVM3_9GAMM|nr:UPF0149 family protein [Pleionea sp. HL-JVS1]WMS88471.1 UPF0149 family protein [Pleionea sp. HL-JVS1]